MYNVEFKTEINICLCCDTGNKIKMGRKNKKKWKEIREKGVKF
jgi:hypothetical protein